MKHLTILNTRQVKKFREQLEEQFGFTEKFEYAFLKSNKGKIYIVSRDIANIDYESLRIDSVGMYFAEQKENYVRLSIEGSQIVGPKAKKKVIELNDEEFRKWFKGEELEIDQDGRGFHIIKHGKDFLGCGFLSDKVLKNFVPKTRRITTEL